jgi:hypothetical protein
MTGAERSAVDGAAPVTVTGDREAFAALFDRHRRELYCYRMLGSFPSPYWGGMTRGAGSGEAWFRA